MINNRQAGRRRGRGGNNNGGQRPGGNPGRPDNGNRIDNRARGNANQLYEKYKNLAAEAQRQGDRVNTEYYWQFADHYFRVLSETRSRFEEQNQRRQREESRDDQYDDGFDNEAEDYGDEGDPIRPGEQLGEAEPRRERLPRDNQPRESYARDNQSRETQQRDERPRRDREDRPRRDNREDRRPARAEQPVAVEDAQPVVAAPVAVTDVAAPQVEEEAPRRRGRPRRERAPEVQDAGEATGFDADRLPPALSAAPEPDAAVEEKPRRRRVRAAAPVEPEAAAG
ncbi:DUF4167 domain-containing protein [uncultured Sphingomonas sp.]|uniref:DUF4167 domain-containing protein n=1 Tax=uncultured Sphingomonas sp. TaxID=158754 RepID=UPI0025DC93D9|nr:DUF4167 domain-containing protein [uncultured Sphingomonas sp.]